MPTFRAFIALYLPTNLKQYCGQLNQSYARQVPDRAVRWVKPEVMHLTLRFLGDTPEAKLPALQAALDQVAATHTRFALQLDRLGCFPNERRPRVIWAGMQGDTEAAAILKTALDAALNPLGWEKENQPFRAHLTLGRVKHSHRQIRLPFGAALEPIPIPVDALHLVESELRPDGPRYTTRHTATLLPAPQNEPGA
jgi:2'-5' RNA ligase